MGSTELVGSVPGKVGNSANHVILLSFPYWITGGIALELSKHPASTPTSGYSG